MENTIPFFGANLIFSFDGEEEGLHYQIISDPKAEVTQAAADRNELSEKR